MLSLAPSPYRGAGGGGDKGFGVGIALVDLKIEDRRKAEPRHIGDQQPRRGLADRREGEGGRDRPHQDEDAEVKRGRHLMLAEEERRPGEVRSEEHTSELQTLLRISYAVFCLKKKKHTYDFQSRRPTT